MARYHAKVGGKGSKLLTKTGTPESGMSAHIAGWNIGVNVELSPDPLNPDLDCIHVYLTGGSNAPGCIRELHSQTEPQ
jgi:hypothetical protein